MSEIESRGKTSTYGYVSRMFMLYVCLFLCFTYVYLYVSRT